MLKAALQKNGRLAERSLALLHDCDIEVSNGAGTLKAAAVNFPLGVLFLRDDDIPQYVADGVADIGIVGENVVREKGKEVITVEPLGFGHCRLSLAVPRHVPYSGIEYFRGKKIATSYPGIVRTYLQRHGVEARIEEISGSVEIAPGIGLADGICDLVGTGSTLFVNGLREVEVVMRSQGVLVARPDLSADKRIVLEKLLFRIRSVGNASRYRYILLNAPDEALPEIIDILPGIKSPTVMPLARRGWSSLHSVLNREEFWDVIDRLKKAGAEGILVIPVETMVV